MPDSAIQEVVCCIGQPVAGNPTQFMMQRALAAAGLDWCCLTLEVSPEDLEDAIRGIRAFGFKGANLTIPHKVAVAAYLDALTESAQLMGAVNCIHWVGNQLIGENTDGRGFVQSLRDVREVAQKKVVLLGAGGTARAIAVELGRAGVAEIQVANRTSENAQKLVDVLRDRLAVQAQVLPWNGPLSIPDGTDLLINATAMGLLDLDARIPLKLETLERTLLVADVVFNPPSTWLLNVAEQRGCTIVNGLGMLVNQAALDFKIWTGLDPDLAVMREAVEEFLEI